MSFQNTSVVSSSCLMAMVGAISACSNAEVPGVPEASPMPMAAGGSGAMPTQTPPVMPSTPPVDPPEPPVLIDPEEDDGEGSQCTACPDLPEEPVLIEGVPEDAAGQFDGAAEALTAPCLFEPEPNSLFPNNWLRPRFKFNASADADLYEIKLEVPNQKHPLVVYTNKTEYYLAKELWEGLAKNSTDVPITASVRALNSTTAEISPVATVEFRISQADANGSIVYWTSSGNTALKGFSVGDEDVAEVLVPAEVTAAQQTTECVGCHTATPDGEFLAYGASADGANGEPSFVGFRSDEMAIKDPDFVTPSARVLLNREGQNAPSFSKAHWSAGDRVVLSMFERDLMWTDLEAPSEEEGTGWGRFKRDGDSNEAYFPQFAQAGDRVVYVSAETATAGGITDVGDLYSIPYNDRAGGAATAIPGASSAEHNEFYPALSSDDQLLSFTAVTGVESSYNNPLAEVFVIPSAGGTATRIVANDPPACLEKPSPGVKNSWGKWAPSAATVDGKDYYWLVFSSERSASVPQLFVTAVVREGGKLTTHGAIQLWNQPDDEGNHTPAWTELEVVVPPPPTIR